MFVYSDELDYEFHLNSILELSRVCSTEVRIYPLQGKDAKQYALMNDLVNDLNALEIKSEIVEVPWEFQKGSHQMLRLARQ